MDVKEFIALTPQAIAELLKGREPSPGTAGGRPECRRSPRWPFPAAVQLWITDAAGQEMEILGDCHNLSPFGIGITCDYSLSLGAKVPIAVHQPEATYHGEAVVRHCTACADNYFIGLEFVETPTY